MSAVFICVAIVLIFAFGREWILVKQTGWDRLSEKYPCRAPFAGKYRACWWAQFTVVGPTRKTVVNVGRMSRWEIRLEFPPYWIGADSQGLVPQEKSVESSAFAVADSMGQNSERE